MKARYVFELIKDNSRVIIPNFGAFLLKGKPKGNIEKDADKLNISFNDFLKFNDGVLIDYIAQKEKVNKFEAELQVIEFVKSIELQLEENGFFDLINVGKLVKDDLGKIKLTQEGVSKEIHQTEKPATHIKDESVHKEIKSIPIEKEIKKPLSKSPQVTERKKQTIKVDNPIKPEKEISVDYSSYQNKSKRGIWILISAIIIIVIFGALYFSGYTDDFFNDKPNITETVLPDNSNTVDGESQVIEESAHEEILADTVQNVIDTAVSTVNTDTIVSDSDIETIKEPEQAVQQDIVENVEVDIENYFEGKNYHIIAASINSRKEAEEFVIKLQNEGFHSRIINEKNNYYRVSFDSYKTKAKALKELDKIVKTKEPAAWYLYCEVD